MSRRLAPTNFPPPLDPHPCEIPAPVEEPTYLIAEAARLLGVAVGTLRNWQTTGRVGTFRVGHRVLYPASEIARLKRASWRPPNPEVNP